ncbi:di-heme oxidoredictase family protein [Wenzhouxiangella sp. EGI_FJ10305]|uniref:di-heme oxidoredictase family protein n=1 Tax=Wenzhouxiangella sp. EGI_FJ10305 TaxID=3243768 RepID=UPI0035DB7921
MNKKNCLTSPEASVMHVCLRNTLPLLAFMILTTMVQPATAQQAAPSFAKCIIRATLGGDVDCGMREIGREVAVESYLSDGEEFELPLNALVAHGEQLFGANWTVQDGAGRRTLKGTGAPLSDPDSPLDFPFNFNRISAPDANSCAGCHNMPRSGGGGDFVTNVHVLGQRFDFATFDTQDEYDQEFPTRGAFDETGMAATLQTIANSRATLGMFGSGYIEMLARQMTAELQALRDALAPGETVTLEAKGVFFGTLARNGDGSWDTSDVEGLTVPSLSSAGADQPPSLIIRPFHQASAVISLRQFSNNAINHHHGIQSVERFGQGDVDGDGYDRNLSTADITALTVYQAQLGVPGRVIPNNPWIEQAVSHGEELFMEVGCGSCHTPSLPLSDEGWVYTEPNPYNPEGNLQPGDAPDFSVNLNDSRLESPRLSVDPATGTVPVPAFTDMKLHDITTGPDDPNCESLNMHAQPGTAAFHSGNCRFLTKRLWGVANEPPYFHHGKFTTMREAIEAHRGEALASYEAWSDLDAYGRDSIIEFLKTLQVLPAGSTSRIVDGNHRPRTWTSQLDGI